MFTIIWNRDIESVFDTIWLMLCWCSAKPIKTKQQQTIFRIFFIFLFSNIQHCIVSRFILQCYHCPVFHSYVRGHVDNLVTEEDDSIQSVNMKKAVLSLLELNFNDRHSMDREVSLASPDDEPKIYRVVEVFVFVTDFKKSKKNVVLILFFSAVLQAATN